MNVIKSVYGIFLAGLFLILLFACNFSYANSVYKVDHSWRTSPANSSYLYWIPSTDGNTKKFSLSMCFKRVSLGGYQGLFTVRNAATSNFKMYLYSDNKLYIDDTTTTNNLAVGTNITFEDTTSWHHLLLSIDTTQVGPVDRVKVFLDGSAVSLIVSVQVAQNANLWVNTRNEYNLGRVQFANGSFYHFDGYLSYPVFVDGIALAPDNFGQMVNNTWMPKEYSGSYGVNGHRLFQAGSLILNK